MQREWLLLKLKKNLFYTCYFNNVEMKLKNLFYAYYVNKFNILNVKFLQNNI